MKNYSMGSRCRIADQAVEAVTKHLLSKPQTIEVLSVEARSDYQNLGIDLLWTFYNSLGNGAMTVEVKADTYYHTGNLFLETISNMTKGTPGCFLGSSADIYAYFFINANVLYWIPLKVAQKWLTEQQERFSIRTTSTGAGDKHFYKTQGVLVPRDILAAEVKGTEVIQL